MFHIPCQRGYMHLQAGVFIELSTMVVELLLVSWGGGICLCPDTDRTI